MSELSTTSAESIKSQSGMLVSFVRYLIALVSLTKPRIMSLLLIAMLCPMILASGGDLSFGAAMWALAGGILVTGSASVINCIYDRDIDAMMERTKNRALVVGSVSLPAAAVFAYVIGTAGLLVLAVQLNVATATMALFGHLFYVIVYTMWLKRTTAQNIVIGGAAGAVPPLVGWVAVTGEVTLTAILLFLVIFLWTPPHFWALALNKNEDYKRAGVPMLPAIAGARATHNQMLFYAITLLPVSILLVLSDQQLGAFSLLVMTVLGLVFAYKIFQLRALPRTDRQAQVKKAWDVFGFSLIYLALFFACIVLDSTFF